MKINIEAMHVCAGQSETDCKKSLDLAYSLYGKHDLFSVLLLDDTGKQKFNFDNQISLVKNHPIGLDDYIYERSLSKYGYSLLPQLNVVNNFVGNIRVIRSDGHFSCPMLATIWYMTRLNIIQSSFPESEKVVSILDKALKRVECDVDVLLEHLGLQDYIKKIERIYI